MLLLLADLESFFNAHSGCLVFWGAIVLMAVVPTISWCVVHWRKNELDADLKREMIARGMSAEEIERILAAKSPSSTKQ